MAEQFTVLTVCTGNIHRSALADALLRQWAAWYLPAEVAAQVHVHSAGFAAPVGAPMGEDARHIAAQLGGDGSGHTATQITDALIRDADLVVTASCRQRDEALSRVPAALRRTFTMREAGRAAASLPARPRPQTVADLRHTVHLLADHRSAAPGEDDVIDPQGHGRDAYLQMIGEEVPALAHLGRALFGMSEPDVLAYAQAAATPETLLPAAEPA